VYINITICNCSQQYWQLC